MYDWSKLLLDRRFADLLGRSKPTNQPKVPKFAVDQFRIPQERDHDRILFSAPFRRMGDKTQVFPLESIESIRTRLTHSYEVANLARSLGLEIADMLEKKGVPNLPDKIIRSVPSTLAAAGLAHDIGNPPFGHQGECAIRSWFKRNKEVLFNTEHCDPNIAKDVDQLKERHQQDFLQFDGNAQTLRVVTKLQLIGDDLGLNLTLSTLATLMKYVAASDEIDGNKQALKKLGYFTSERPLVERLRDEVELKGISRHPLALVVEACDDIAYSVLDAEDAIKKGLVSFNDLLTSLEDFQASPGQGPDASMKCLCEFLHWEYNRFRSKKLHPSELQDIVTQKFRVHAIHLMVCAVAEAFEENYRSIMDGTYEGELIQTSQAGGLCTALKKFDKENAFGHKTVLEIELNGHNTLNRLMDFLWIGISEREEYNEVSSERKSPFAIYAYSRISKTYRRIFEGNEVENYHKSPESALPIRYREMQLLTDMVSGMTDQFCIDLYNDLRKHYREMSPVNETLT